MIPIFSNTLGEEEIAAVRRVFESRWLGAGPECKAFEQELAELFRVQRVLHVSSATAGLYLAVRCLGLRPGDEVIIPANHFIGCANAVYEAGAVPVWADVDPVRLNVTGKEIERLRTERTVGVIVNHYGGHPANMRQVLMAGYRLWVLEDAANAPASTYHGRAVGTLGDAGVWSFDSMKILVMAEGGALWFRDQEALQRAWRLRNCGLDATSGSDNLGKKDRWWEFDVPEPSGKALGNDLLAAIGREQLKKLPRFVAQRERVWSVYQSELAGVGDLVLPPEPLKECTSSYYFYWIQTVRRDELARYLTDNRVYCTMRYYPLHKVFGGGPLPVADRLAEELLTIPIHQNLTEGEQAKVIELIKEFYR